MILMIGCVGHICSKICVSFVHVNHRRRGHWDQARVFPGYGGCLHQGEEGDVRGKDTGLGWSVPPPTLFLEVFIFPDVGLCVKNLLMYMRYDILLQFLKNFLHKKISTTSE